MPLPLECLSKKHQDTKIHKTPGLPNFPFVIFGALVFSWQKKAIRTFSTNKINFFLLSLIFASCSLPQEKEKNISAESSVKYAQGFTIETTAHFKKLVVLNPWNNFEPYATYYILKDSLKLEVNPNELNFYSSKTPKKIALHTAAQAASLKALELDIYVKGITDPRFFYEKQYADRLDSKELIQTSNQVSINKERMLLLQPDIVITSGWNTINSDYQLLIKMGIPPLFMIEWMETNPLGRAEWIKVLGLLFDKEKECDSIFRAVESNYLTLKNQKRSHKSKPKVLHGEEYNGVWYVAGGQSFIANIYKDAGADYLWKENDQTGSLAIDLEVVLEKGVNSDFWFTTFGQNEADINHIKQEKYKLLKSVKNENIYSNIKRKREMGGNDFWETGNYRPDLILEDIVQIIHQESKSKDKLFFYEKLNIK